MYAIANPNKLVDLVKYMVENLDLHTGISIREPIYDHENDGINIATGQTADPGKFWNTTLALSLAVKNSDTKMLDYLWNDIYYLWDISDLDSLIDLLYNNDFLDALSLVLKGKTFR